jgi:hypothetical protein
MTEKHSVLKGHGNEADFLGFFAEIGSFADSPTRRVGESFFNYEYLREYEAEIGTARNVV